MVVARGAPVIAVKQFDTRDVRGPGLWDEAEVDVPRIGRFEQVPVGVVPLLTVLDIVEGV